MGREHHVGQRQQIRVQRGLAFKDIEPGREKPALAQCQRQRRVVDHAAARDVGQCGARLHQREFGRADQVVRRRAVRHDDHQVIGFAHEFVLADPARAKLLLDRCVEPAAVVVDHFHAETQRAASGDGLADAPHAQHAQRRTVHIGARQQVVGPVGPTTGAQEMLSLGDAAGRGHHQREAEIRSGLGQHVGRIAHQHTARRARRQVDVVVAHRHARDHAQVRASRQQRGVDTRRTGHRNADAALQPSDQRFVRPLDVVVAAAGRVDLEVVTQSRQHLVKHWHRHQHTGSDRFGHVNASR